MTRSQAKGTSEGSSETQGQQETVRGMKIPDHDDSEKNQNLQQSIHTTCHQGRQTENTRIQESRVAQVGNINRLLKQNAKDVDGL